MRQNLTDWIDTTTTRYTTQMKMVGIETVGDCDIINILPNKENLFELFESIETNPNRFKWVPRSETLRVMELIGKCWLVDPRADFPDVDPFFVRVQNRTIIVDTIYKLPAYVLVFGHKKIKEFLNV